MKVLVCLFALILVPLSHPRHVYAIGGSIGVFSNNDQPPNQLLCGTERQELGESEASPSWSEQSGEPENVGGESQAGRRAEIS